MAQLWSIWLTSKDPGSIPGWISIFITCTTYYYYPPFHTSSSPAQQRGRRPECRPGAWKPDGGSHSSEQQKESWNTCCGGSASDHWEAQSPLSVTAAKKNNTHSSTDYQKIAALWLQFHQAELTVVYVRFPDESLWHTFHIIQTFSHLENPHWELWGGGSGEPETEVRVWLGEFLKGLLQGLQPANEQMDVLQHQPVPACRCSVQQLKGNLYIQQEIYVMV